MVMGFASGDFFLNITSLPVNRASLFRNNSIVQPRVLAKTVEIERAIITIEGQHILVDSPTTPQADVQNARKRRGTITEQVFYEALEEVSPELPLDIQTLFNDVTELGLRVEPGASGMMVKTGEGFNVGLFHKDGYLRNYGCGSSEKGKQYLQNLSEILNDMVVHVASDGFNSTVKKQDGSYVSLQELLEKREEWFILLEEIVKEENR